MKSNREPEETPKLPDANTEDDLDTFLSTTIPSELNPTLVFFSCNVCSNRWRRLVPLDKVPAEDSLVQCPKCHALAGQVVNREDTEEDSAV